MMKQEPVPVVHGGSSTSGNRGLRLEGGTIIRGHLRKGVQNYEKKLR